MPDPDPFEAWKRKRAETAVPEDFAEVVMARLQFDEQKPGQRVAGRFRGLFRSRAFRVGVCSAACAVGLLRILQIFFVFFAEQASR